MPLVDDLFLVAAGHRHGPIELSSLELERSYPAVRDGWSEKYLGMTERRRLKADDSIVPLAVGAVHDALDRAGWGPERIDTLVCGATFLDQLVPPTSSLISQATNPDATCFDVNACCAGFPYAMAVAASMATWDPAISGLAVCVAEHISPWIDHDDPESSIFFGDAAGAALLARERRPQSFRVVAAELANDNEHPQKVAVPRDGAFHHDGHYSYKQVVRLSGLTGRRALDLAGATGADVAVLVGHQSSTRLLDDVADAVGVARERRWTNVSWAGNQSGAGALTAFSGGWLDHGDDLRDGDLVLVVSVGAGYTAGAVLLEWQA